MRRAQLVLLAFAVTFLASGCGGHKRLTHAELVSHMNAVCQSAIQQVIAIPAPRTSNLDRVGLYIVHLRRVATYVLNEERRIRPPAADEALFRKAIGFHVQIINTLTRLRAAARRHDRRAVRRGYKLLQGFAHNPYEERLGISSC